MNARRRVTAWILATLTVAVCGSAAQAAPRADLTALPGEGWVAWSVPAIDVGDGPCCYTNWHNGNGRRGCVLGDQHHSLSWSDDAALDASGTNGGSDELVVYVQREGGQTRRVQALAANCPVEVDGALTRLDGVASTQSLEWLDAAVGEARSERVREGSLVAMAHHADAMATRLLARRAGEGESKQVREQALFWLALTRGQDGLPTVQHAALHESDRHLRQHAVFSLSQSKLPEAAATLEQLARDTAQSDEARGEALFWLAQSGAPSARGMAEDVLRGRPGHELEDKAIFALSQLPSGGDAALIGIIEGDYPRSAKKQALFWLGQSGSEDALRAIDRLLAAGQAH
ncbi:MAG: HEAT repeat domain-containing protein [Xanthomonadales bacterium]|nr:HEAT repeat domain-containing protein [Xanthomonadales bacterium]